MYNEVIKDCEPNVVVTELDAQLNGIIPAWVGRTDLVGKELLASDGTVLGTITAFNSTTGVLEGVELAVDDIVKLQNISATNSPSWQVLPKATPRQITLNMNDPQQAAYLGEKLFTAYVMAVMAVLEALGDTNYTLLQVQGAIMALSQQGVNVDSFIAQQAEVVEDDRRNGNLPPNTLAIG
jgi:hypothetical protein